MKVIFKSFYAVNNVFLAMLSLKWCYPKKYKTAETEECLGLKKCLCLRYFSKISYLCMTQVDSRQSFFSWTHDTSLSLPLQLLPRCHTFSSLHLHSSSLAHRMQDPRKYFLLRVMVNIHNPDPCDVFTVMTVSSFCVFLYRLEQILKGAFFFFQYRLLELPV